MAVQLQKRDGGKIVVIAVSEKLTQEDYDTFVRKVEQLIQEFGKIRVLFEMKDFHGWKAGALWKDIKFDLKHFADIEKIAFLGDKKWEKGMSVFCRPFTTAKMRYFDVSQANEADTWITK
jgi:hypothetical protein